MVKASANVYPFITMAESASPSNPSSGEQLMFISTGGQLFLRDNGGAEHQFGELSDADPEALGEVGPGTSDDVARIDHVHPATITANPQTSNYTLALSDAGKVVEMNVGSANNLTVPANGSVAFPVGTVIEVCQIGSGQTTIVEDSGVTVNTPETLVLTGQWSTVSLRKRATDSWVLAGDVEASA